MAAAVFILLVYFVFLPGFLGICLFGKKAFAPAGGFLILLALFQAVGVPFVFFGRSLSELSFTVNLLLFTIAAAVVILRRKEIGKLFSAAGSFAGTWRKTQTAGLWKRKAGLFLWGVFFALLGFQLVKALTLSFFDGDDAYYVAQSVAAVEQDSLYRVIPYTGFATMLDMRHAMAVFPIWIAFLAKMSGVHPAILCHSVLPLILIPGMYGFYGLLFRELSPKKEGEKPVLPGFLILTALTQIFGSVSIYTPAAFLIGRTWQGKAVLGSILLPALLWLLLRTGREKKVGKETAILLIALNMAAAMTTSMGIFLAALMIAGGGIFLAVWLRSFRLLFRLAACSAPCLVYAAVYILA